MKKNILFFILFNCFTLLAYTQDCPSVAVNPAGTVNLSSCKPMVLSANAGFNVKATPPTALALTAGFTIDNKIYVGLGYQDVDEGYNPILLQDMWMYDPAVDAWTAIAPFPGDARVYEFSFSVNGKGYIGGGLSQNGNPLSDVWEYNPVTDEWTQKNDFVSPYALQMASFTVNNNAYVIGEDVFNNANGLWQYDQANDAWITKTGLPGNLRQGVSAFSVGSTAYAGGGADYYAGALVNDFYAYNYTTDSWSKIADFPGTPREYAVGFSIGSLGYIAFGSSGAPGSYYTDVWAYDPAGNTWAAKTAFTAEPRLFPTVLDTDDMLYVTGGIGFSGVLVNVQDLWAYSPSAAFDSYLWTTTDGTLPADVTTAAITVTTPGTYTVTASKTGCSDISADVVVVPAATITGFDPTTADASTSMNITGENFYNVTNVLIGGSPAANWTPIDFGLIIATPGNGAGNDSIGVVTGCDTAWATGFVPVCTTGNWNGHIDSDWNNAGNWCGGVIPGATDDVLIPGGVNHYPVLSTEVSVNNLSVDYGGAFTIADGGILKAAGNIFNNSNGILNAAAGKIVLNGPLLQIIGGDVDVKDLEIDNPEGAELDYTGYTYVYGTLTVTNGVFYTHEGLVLASNREGTATVAPPGSGNPNQSAYIDGGVEVDRFIPAKRAWRMLTAPLYDAGSIYDNWQNSGNTCSCRGNAGVEIFGPVTDDGNGVTPNPVAGAGAYSMRSYLYQVDQWANVENTYDSLLSVDGATSAANKPYTVFVTGPYGGNHITSGADTTTLMAYGYLQQGDQVFEFAPNDAGQTGAYRMIGNPYASPIDLRNLDRENTKDAYWIWDPRRAGDYGVGGYVSFSYDPVEDAWDQDVIGVTTQTLDLQSGGTFFVEAEDPAQTVKVYIGEGSKTNVVNNATFFAPPAASKAQQLRITLNRTLNNVPAPIDGVLAKFGNNYNKGLGDDVDKLFNYDENLSFTAGGTYQAIRRQPLPVDGDTLQLFTYALKAKTAYGFTIQAQNFAGVQTKAWFVDNYLKTKTAVDLTGATDISFSTTADVKSRDTGRFIIVFAKAGALANTNTNIKAWQQANSVQVQWQTAGELDVQQYVVERSTGGQVFTALQSNVAPRNTGKTEAYTIADNQPVAGDNLYRVQATHTDGSRTYSNIAKVTVIKDKALTISPNPVAKSAHLNVTMTSMAAGRYTIQLFSTDGKKMLQRLVEYNGATATQVINVPASIATGSYRLVLQDEKGNSWKQQVVIQ